MSTTFGNGMGVATPLRPDANRCKEKPPAEMQPGARYVIRWGQSGAEQQNSCRLFVAAAIVRANRAVEQLVVLEINLEERRPFGNLPGNERLGERIFDVPLQCAAQGTCPVAA